MASSVLNDIQILREEDSHKTIMGFMLRGTTKQLARDLIRIIIFGFSMHNLVIGRRWLLHRHGIDDDNVKASKEVDSTVHLVVSVDSAPENVLFMTGHSQLRSNLDRHFIHGLAEEQTDPWTISRRKNLQCRYTF